MTEFGTNRPRIGHKTIGLGLAKPVLNQWRSPMFSTSKQPVDPAHFQYFAESLADILSAGSDGQRGNQVLSVLSKQVNTHTIA